MKAAVVTRFDSAPMYTDFREPEPRTGFIPMRMLAAGVHRIVRSLAAGAHYSSGNELPFIPGVDGVGVLEDGRRVYAGGTPEPFGTLAERTLIPEKFFVPVPDTLESTLAAAIVNPAMSSWLPLVGTARLRTSGTVLVLGATGVSGGLAVQVALHLGAARVIAAGRNTQRLTEIGVDPRVETVAIDDSFIEAIRSLAADGIDVVLDYLWGPVGEATLEGLRRNGRTRVGHNTTYVQIGALAGSNLTLDAAILRSTGITLVGSGVGSIDPALLLTEIPTILECAANGGLSLDVRARPLAHVQAEWSSEDRVVLVP